MSLVTVFEPASKFSKPSTNAPSSDGTLEARTHRTTFRTLSIIEFPFQFSRITLFKIIREISSEATLKWDIDTPVHFVSIEIIHKTSLIWRYCSLLFNSLAFGAFLPVVFILYWILQKGPLRLHNLFLIVASYAFYAYWDYRFL